MEIRFIKEYRALLGDGTCSIYRVGQTWSVHITLAQWLIDNGFAEKAEEVKESGWKPEVDDTYYYVRYTLSISDWCNIGYRIWEDDEDDESRYLIGNVFKTEESAQRFVDYLEAVETVRHDEGFMKISRKIDHDTYGYAISHSDWNKSLIAEKVESINHAGQFYFDTSEHAEASLDKHRDKWRTILNYDWSKE